MEKQDRGALFGALFARAAHDRAPHEIAATVAEFRRAARSLARLAVAGCNYQLSDRERARSARLDRRIRETAAQFGFSVDTDGDPRGAVVRLIDPANLAAGDSWGGGWEVY